MENSEPKGAARFRRTENASARTGKPKRVAVIGTLQGKRRRLVVARRADRQAMKFETQIAAAGSSKDQGPVVQRQVDERWKLGAVLRNDRKMARPRWSTSGNRQLASPRRRAREQLRLPEAQLVVAQDAVQQRAQIDVRRQRVDAEHLGSAAPAGIGDAQIGELDR